jgi:hypothetical protein
MLCATAVEPDEKAQVAAPALQAPITTALATVVSKKNPGNAEVQVVIVESVHVAQLEIHLVIGEATGVPRATVTYPAAATAQDAAPTLV